MTELKNYNHAEQVTTPDDLKQSEQHGADRLNTQAELAESRIKEISNKRNLRGTTAGGLDEFYDGLEKKGFDNETSRTLARLVSERAMDVVSQSADDYQKSLTGSSAAKFEGAMLGYTAKDMMEQINGVKKTGLLEQESFGTLRGFYAKAFEEEKEQRDALVEKRGELDEQRGRWMKLGQGSLSVLSFGAYSRPNTEKLNKVADKQFKKINDRIDRMESKVGKRVAPEQSRIRRTLVAAADPKEKSDLKKELMDAVQHPGSLASLKLTKWEIKDDDLQGKIDFLAAAKGLEFVKKDMGIISISEGKRKQQKEMINSAQAQQAEMKTPAPFEAVRNEMKKTDGLKAAETVSSISDLVNSITNDLTSAGIDIEAIYGTAVTKADLLTDTVRLTMLVKALHKKKALRNDLQLKTKQGLLAWIEKQDEDTAGGMEHYEQTKVKDELNVLQETRTGVLDKTATLLAEVRGIDATTDFATLNLVSICNDIQIKYQNFLNKESDKDIPSEDFEIIKKIWAKALDARTFLLGQVGKWKGEQKVYAQYEADKDDEKEGKAKDYQKKITLLDGADTDPASIAYLEKEKAGLPTTTTKAAKEALERKIVARYEEKRSYEDKKSDLRNLKAPSFSGLDKIQPLLDSLSAEKAMDYGNKIKKGQRGPGKGRVNERITKSLRIDNFADELDKKFVEQLEKNDQFEQLKGVSKGTKVEINYKETSATTLRFPDQLNSTRAEEFVVMEANESGVMLQKAGVAGKTISILGAAAKGGIAYKNAKVARTGGAWSSAIAYNFKIAA